MALKHLFVPVIDTDWLKGTPVSRISTCESIGHIAFTVISNNRRACIIGLNAGTKEDFLSERRKVSTVVVRCRNTNMSDQKNNPCELRQRGRPAGHPQWENSICYGDLRLGLIPSCHYVLMFADLPIRRLQNFWKPAP